MRYDPRLRKLGYRARTGPSSPILGMLERAGVRPRPLNRAYPAHGHYIARCPWCDAADALYVEPDGETWMTTCGCSTGGTILDLSAALILPVVAA